MAALRPCLSGRILEVPVPPLRARRLEWLAVAGLALSSLGARIARCQEPVVGGLPVPRPPSGLVVSDVPNDAGRTLDLVWKLSPDDLPGQHVVTTYYLERSETPAGPWTRIDSVAAGTTTKSDQSVSRNVEYFYRVIAAGPGGVTPAGSITGPVRATSQWINQTRWSVLVGTILFFSFVLYYIASVQAGKKPFVRRIPGIDAIEEAIGRATEMGRPVLYVPGIQDINDI